jgi:carbonic anhydrase
MLRQAALGTPAVLSIDVDPSVVGLGSSPHAAPQQHPFAAVVGCADARVPIEIIFSEGPNDLFVVRIAGNGLGDDVLGSLTYAIDHLQDSLRTIVVLGHSQCGAVTAAVDVYLNPARYVALMTQPGLRHALDRLLVLVQTATTWLERVHGQNAVRLPGYRKALIEISIALNAALTSNGIHLGLNIGSRPALSVVYGVYLLDEHLLWCPRPETDWHGLAPAPHDADDLVRLYDLVAASPRLAGILNSP